MASNALEIIGPVPRGRPSWDYDDAIGREICERLTEGESLRRICQDAGMPSRTVVYDWILENPVFADQYARARELQADSFADDMQEVALDLTILPEHKRLIIDTMKWRAGRQRPRKWGDKVLHEHEHEVHTKLEAGSLPEGIRWLADRLQGGDAASKSGPMDSAVGEG